MTGRAFLAPIVSALAVAILTPASAGAASIQADYRFQGAYVSSHPGAPDIGPVGSGNQFVTETVGCAPTRVFSFLKGSGLQTETGGGVFPDNYSVVALFRFAETSGFRRIQVPGGNPTPFFGSDSGIYDFNGRLSVYDKGLNPPNNPGAALAFANDTYAEVAFTYSHDSPGLPNQTAGYVNGVPQWAGLANTTEGNAVAMRFFADNDPPDATGQDSAGAVSRIRIYNGILTPAEVAAIHASGPIAAACDPTKRATAAVNRKVKVKGGARGRLTVLTGIDVGCPALSSGACKGRALIEKGGAAKRLATASKLPKRLGKKRLTVAAGQTKGVKVKLTRKASDALRAKGKLKVKISVKLAAPGTTAAVASRTAKLKPPK
jgi:hypothetical protein